MKSGCVAMSWICNSSRTTNESGSNWIEKIRFAALEKQTNKTLVYVNVTEKTGFVPLCNTNLANY